MQENVHEEIAYLSLGDKRRDKRFIKIIEKKVSVPCASIPEMGEKWSDIKMTYEFYNNDKVSESGIASCIAQATVCRCNEQAVVLNIMDTTSINFSSGAAGLGYLDHGVGEGLMVHNSLALDGQGTPLGILSQKIWAREKSTMGKAKLRSGKDISEKESYRWIESMQHAEVLLKEVGSIVHIADRESDIYELFTTPRSKNSELLIRATHERKTLLGNSMWKEVEAQPVLSSFELDLPKVTTEGIGKVQMEVRVSMIMLSPPVNKPEQLSMIVYGILVKEIGKKEKGLEWRLISTKPVNTASEALQFVQWYGYRWRIERLHYVLKSGCRIEELQMRNVKALRKAILVYSLCAFKIMQMLYTSRTEPDTPCTKYFSELEWKVLRSISSKSPVTNPRAPSLQEMVKEIAKLGGYIGRNGDGPPGIKNLWKGLQQFNMAIRLVNNKNQWFST